MSSKLEAYVHRKVPTIMTEGIRGKPVSQKQAVAVAFAMGRRRARKV